MAGLKSVWNLIAIPALLTLGITLLRLVGDLERWPSPWFSDAAGGGLALVGITWLPIFFGPWFAIKLAARGDGPSSNGKSIGYGILATVVVVGSMVFSGIMFTRPTWLLLVPAALMLGAAFIPGLGWRALNNSLLAYAFAARLPVLLVMYFAMKGNGGVGWGTHYDGVLPVFAKLSFVQKYVIEALIPQMTLWIGWTVAVGALFGAASAAIGRQSKTAADAVV